ncbi:MAG: type II secretion system F family protein [Desulfurococcales archaeon]|nr:type II secretion system F family protein [Desulfurococcales archaeon]
MREPGALDEAEVRFWEPLYRRYSSLWKRLFPGAERFIQGGPGWTPEGFYSGLLSLTILSYFVFSLSLLVFYIGGIRVSPLTVAIVAVLLLLAPPLAGHAYAWSLHYTRGERMESRFHAFAGVLGTLLSAGMPVEEAFREIESRYMEELAPFRREVAWINRLVSLNVPMRDALQWVASRTPSPSLSGLLYSLSETYRTGASMADVVWGELSSHLSDLALKVDRAVTSIGGIIESFVTLAVLLPTLTGVLAMLAAFGPLLGLGLEALIAVTSLLIVPLVSVFVAVISDWIVGRVRP